MPDSSKFPHLKWSHKGTFTPKFSGGRGTPDEVQAAKDDPVTHTGHLSTQLGEMRKADRELRERRKEEGLPEIEGKGFILRVPEGADIDALTHALGVELVAETDKGLMFAASESVSLERLEEVLAKFQIGEKGGGSAASLLDVFHSPDDSRKLDELLSGRVRNLWPFDDATIYTFDLSIQSAASTRQVKWKGVRKRNTESEEEFAKRKHQTRLDDHIRADEIWMDVADQRMAEVQTFLDHYKGEAMTGLQSEEPREDNKGVIFPDSITVRVRMSGRGFRDIVENLPHLFEVSFPQDVEFLPGSLEAEGVDGDLEFQSPAPDAPTVCVIDSGIQESHRWLEKAIDSESSRCFIPNVERDDVADYLPPRGHGTRVAGAVLYASAIPKDGLVNLAFWIQNARVLGRDGHIPLSLPPERYLSEIVAHFGKGQKATKIYNHSIFGSEPCPTRRMCAWAAKLDDLSHREDVLFIQIAGNVSPSVLTEALDSGLGHPKQLLENHCKVSSPGQSMHALTVGSIAHAVAAEEGWRSFASAVGEPSAFSRAGYAYPWQVVKPEVVEFGGDRLFSDPPGSRIKSSEATSPELLASTLHGEPAISRDDVGTSFAAPKVAHIAAHLQNLFPNASSQLYRALIVQSARWPEWAESASNYDEVLRTIGYGLPTIERATENSSNRVTLVTPDAVNIGSKQYHLYHFRVPDEIRSAASEAKIRIDVTLSYTASPRRTRSRRTGYLETWLDWRAIHMGEPLDRFEDRMQGIKGRSYPGMPWTVHQQTKNGDVEETSRDKGSVQKDWTVLEAHAIPENFAIAVRAHVGWNHKDEGGIAKYCLAVTFEASQLDLPVYTAIQTEVEVQEEVELEVTG